MIKNLFKLATATIIGQIATLVLMSTLFKMGYKDDIANFALLIAFLAIITPISTLRLDIAFIVDIDKKPITDYVIIAILFTLLIIMPSLFYLAEILSSKYIEDIRLVPAFSFLIMCNLGVLFSQAYLNRSGEFGKISTLYVVQPLIQCGSAITLAMLQVNNLLIYSLILSQLCICMLTLSWGFKSFSFSNLEIFTTLKKNWRYPILSAPGAVMNGYQMGLPIIYATQYFSPSNVAVYYLLQKFISSPMGILSNAAYNISTHELLGKSKLQTLRYLLGYCGFMIFIILLSVFFFYVIPESTVSAILEIDYANKYVVMIFTISIIIRSIASPLSAVIPICGAIHIEFIWKLIAFILTYFCLFEFAVISSFNDFLFVISILDILLYSALILLSVYSIYTRD